MKTIRPLLILAMLGLGMLSAQAQEVQRVIRAHCGGQVIFQTPTHWMDSIKTDGREYLTFYYSDASWSRRLAEIDSVTFAMAATTDTTLTIDTAIVDTAQMVRIDWNGDQVSIQNPFSTDSIQVTAAGGHVTVKSKATAMRNVVYTLSGSSNDGWLLFDKLSTPAIVRLDGLSLQSVGKAAINIDKNQPVVLHLAAGTANSLSDSDSNTDKSVVYGKGTLSVQGSGALTIRSAYANGLQGKRGVTFAGGSTSIEVTHNTAKGVKSDGHFVMNGGTLAITASGSVAIDTSDSYETGYDMSYCTGIKTGDVESGTEGNVIVNGGTLTITCPAGNAGGRCISSDYSFYLNGGRANLSTAGNGLALGGSGTSATDGYACACIKVDSNVIVNGGYLDARSTGIGGRGIVADGRMTIGQLGADDNRIHLYVQTSGAPVNAAGSGGGPGGWPGGGSSNVDYFKGLPKGIKIEGSIIINSGHIGAYCAQTSGDPTGEAIESKDSIIINGGVVEANAYDDAINAARYLEVNGGKVWAYSRGNDGIDCNGNTNVHGGLLLIKGNEVGLDAATDAGGRFFVDGGTIVTLGGTMGAWDSPNVSGSQKYLSLNNNGSNGLCVKNANGDVVFMYRHSTPSGSGFIENYTDPGAKPPGGGGSSQAKLVFSSPDIVSGTYQYWTTTTFNGGNSWHGFYFDSTPSTSGSASSATAR